MNVMKFLTKFNFLITNLSFFTGCAAFFGVNLVQSWKKYNAVIVSPMEKVKFLCSWELSSWTGIFLALIFSCLLTSLIVDVPLFKSSLHLFSFGFVNLALLLFGACGFIYLCEKLELASSMKMLDLDQKILDKLSSNHQGNDDFINKSIVFNVFESQ